LELHQVPAPHVVQHEVQLVHLTREERKCAWFEAFRAQVASSKTF
jgi:hypothetical protein